MRQEKVLGEEVFYLGPPISDGPLPALFYFSLAGDESLTLDPFNQPVTHLDTSRMRVFSMTLPGHGEGFEKTKAIRYWADELYRGNDLVTHFFDRAESVIRELIRSSVITTLATAGLSRGGFVATHLASRISEVSAVLGFAPLTDLSYSQDFKETTAGEPLALMHLIDTLTDKRLRFYIGNRDIAVGTSQCYSFIHTLTEHTYHHGIRSPQVELIIYPSIGHRGHGTPPEIFKSGARWLEEHL